METIKLSNGVEMPALGYGVYLISPQECERCVAKALSAGYRLIDTAQAYYNEEGVGAAVAKSGIAREEMFLTTKVWYTNAGEQKAMESIERIERSLQKLRTDYIDLLLIHQALGDVYGTWRAMEKALEQGKVRAIGISNFMGSRFYEFVNLVDVKPMVMQLQCNTSVQQNQMISMLRQYNCAPMAWSPLGGQGIDDVVKNPVLAFIGSLYNKTAAQVALRWLTQRGIIAIPKSTHIERMRQNLDIFDFRLTDEEMAVIASLNEHDSGTYNFLDPQLTKTIMETHPKA